MAWRRNDSPGFWRQPPQYPLPNYVQPTAHGIRLDRPRWARCVPACSDGCQIGHSTPNLEGCAPTAPTAPTAPMRFERDSYVGSDVLEVTPLFARGVFDAAGGFGVSLTGSDPHGPLAGAAAADENGAGHPPSLDSHGCHRARGSDWCLACRHHLPRTVASSTCLRFSKTTKQAPWVTTNESQLEGGADGSHRGALCGARCPQAIMTAVHLPGEKGR
jgi:hypothetical protein